MTVMAGEIVDRLRALAARVADAYGLAIFDVEFKRGPSGWLLRVSLDRPGDDRPVGIDDCALVSQELGALLDVEDLIDRAYTLEVSSPGLDRPLRNEADYRRFTGKLAKIVTATAIDNQHHFRGRLAGVAGENVLIDLDEGRRQVRIPFGTIARARLEVEF